MRRLVLVSCCLAAVAVVVKIGWPQGGEPELCLGAKQTYERMRRSGSIHSPKQVREQLARACEAGRLARVTATPTPVPYTGRPGCQSEPFRPTRPLATTELYGWVRPAQPVHAVLLLIPANRPADVMATADFVATEYYSGAQLAAVARRWEERFGAILTGLGPGGATFSVGAPPRTPDEAVGLAAEQIVIAPDEPDGDMLGSLRRHLERGTPFESDLPRLIGWELGWAD